MKVKDILEKWDKHGMQLVPTVAGQRITVEAQQQLHDYLRGTKNEDEEIPVCWVHMSTFVDHGAIIGADTHVWHFGHIMGEGVIGSRCNIGQNVFVDNNAVIENDCKIQNNVSVYKCVMIKSDVFVGPSAVFTNVLNPRSKIKRDVSEYSSTLVADGATIGANATVICGAQIGRYAMVGAGATVGGRKEVPDYAIVYGDPLRVHGYMCECGEVLERTSPETLETAGRYVRTSHAEDYDTQCSECSARYRLDLYSTRDAS